MTWNSNQSSRTKSTFDIDRWNSIFLDRLVSAELLSKHNQDDNFTDKIPIIKMSTKWSSLFVFHDLQNCYQWWNLKRIQIADGNLTAFPDIILSAQFNHKFISGTSGNELGVVHGRADAGVVGHGEERKEGNARSKGSWTTNFDAIRRKDSQCFEYFGSCKTSYNRCLKFQKT